MIINGCSHGGSDIIWPRASFSLSLSCIFCPSVRLCVLSVIVSLYSLLLCSRSPSARQCCSCKTHCHRRRRCCCCCCLCVLLVAHRCLPDSLLCWRCRHVCDVWQSSKHFQLIMMTTAHCGRRTRAIERKTTKRYFVPLSEEEISLQNYQLKPQDVLYAAASHQWLASRSSYII